jgi:CubicO group peptidase (beta-lactamase class C family)
LNRLTAVASLLLVTMLLIPAQTALRNPRSAQVDSIMARLVRPTSPGAAVLVIKDGKVVHEKGYGLANIKAKLPITTSSTFDLASVSKQFTAMAIMILAERGKLDYDDPLTKFFPEFPPYASRITVRHLLNHTAGLPNYVTVFWRRPAGISSEPTAREVVTMLAQLPAPLSVPGEKYEYSNSGYVVLGQIVAQVSGVTFPEFMRANVFAPLGMSATIVTDPIRAPALNRAVGYRRGPRGFSAAGYSPLNRIYGDRSVYSSLDDMYRWDQALYTDRLVRKRTLAEAFRPATLNNGTLSGYGFGWQLLTMDGLPVLAHNGAWAGFRTYIMRFPSEHFSVIVLSNASNFNATAVANRIAQLYLADKITTGETEEL